VTIHDVAHRLKVDDATAEKWMKRNQPFAAQQISPLGPMPRLLNPTSPRGISGRKRRPVRLPQLPESKSQQMKIMMRQTEGAKVGKTERHFGYDLKVVKGGWCVGEMAKESARGFIASGRVLKYDKSVLTGGASEHGSQT
jgi:hypothetical protein